MLTRAEFEVELAKVTWGGGLGKYLFRDYFQKASPLEEDLCLSIRDVLDFDATLAPEMVIHTKIGTFLPDLILRTPGKITGIECDGQKYHQDPLRDEARDAALLETGLIDQILRFRGDLLSRRKHDATMILTKMHPEAFSKAGFEYAEERASVVSKKYWFKPLEGIVIPMARPLTEEDAYWEPDDDEGCVPRREQIGSYSVVRYHTLAEGPMSTRVKWMAAMITAGDVRTRDELADKFRAG